MANNKKKTKSHEQKLAAAYAKRNKAGTIGPLQMAGSALGAAGGFMLGGPLGAAAGMSLGGAAGNAAGYYTGTGDYRYKGMKNNMAMGRFQNPNQTVITHREYITDIKAGAIPGGATSSVFDIVKYAINPGVATTFPWLASIAANYEEYEILGMVFSFVSTSGESVAATNTALGAVILATEYDPTKPAFQNKQAMENYQFASSSKPSVSQIHAIECKKSLTPVKQLYVRSGTVTGTDLRWNDFGNFYVATVGYPSAGANLGELWCTYKVKLLKPRLPITVSLGGQIASGLLTRTGGGTATPLGTITVRSSGSIPLTVISAEGSVSFPATPNMNYIVTVYAKGSVGTWASSSLTGALIYPIFQGGTSPYMYGNTGADSVLSVSMQCTNTDTDDVIKCFFSLSSATTVVDIIVTQVDETI